MRRGRGEAPASAGARCGALRELGHAGMSVEYKCASAQRATVKPEAHRAVHVLMSQHTHLSAIATRKLFFIDAVLVNLGSGFASGSTRNLSSCNRRVGAAQHERAYKNLPGLCELQGIHIST
eukprot:TRINITY_DN18153_c0_g1_i1.p1 TRINITY_DN18153_c0_g1~~TRINITY_DN18153_c0_g1_i1.p1  ORF type:complete len:122 (-),score=1.51 TRINITY_DN18153_c0_g1_i1:478-843(-)